MAMRWHDLLFAHWPVAERDIRAAVPAELEIDTFEGRAWLGIVPFRMTGVRLRGLPPIPGPGAFPEINVRTYVRHRERPGVWFFSLDATSRIAIRVARAWFGLPYHPAAMNIAREGAGISFRSERLGPAGPARFEAEYGPAGEPVESPAGGLEHFLTERYCLFTRDRTGGLRVGEIQHRPWPLQSGRAVIVSNTMAFQLGLELDGEPLLHFARRLDVLVWGPRTALTAEPKRGPGS